MNFILYIFIVHFLWAIYATVVGKRIIHDSTSFTLFITFILNFLICPISIIVAIYNEIINPPKENITYNFRKNPLY